MAYDLIGKNFTRPTSTAGYRQGQIREDFRADGMVFCRADEPMPHAKVKKIDPTARSSSRACSRLTADDVPAFPPPNNPILTKEPLYRGRTDSPRSPPETEQLARMRSNLIKIDMSRCRSGRSARQPASAGPTARPTAIVPPPGSSTRHQVDRARTSRRGRATCHGQARRGMDLWRLEAGVQKAKLVLDESSSSAPGHHCMEPAPPWRIGRTAGPRVRLKPSQTR